VTSRAVPWVAALLAGAALALGAVVMIGSAARAAEPIEIRIRHSAYLPGAIVVPRGVPVTLVLRNEDPIDHEWIVGDEAVHTRHRTGTEPIHASRPTEVTVPAGETRRTTVRWDEPGTYRFVCHLPGHEAYGMVGTVTVRP
jgi:uncharacterized cupredoxin-like copper-binding protein